MIRYNYITIRDCFLRGAILLWKKNNYKKFILDTLVELLQIDSPSGFCYEINKYLAKKLKEIGCKEKLLETKKGMTYFTLQGSKSQSKTIAFTSKH